MMLQRAKKCRTRLQAYCSNWTPGTQSTDDDDDAYDLRDDILSAEEWKGVREVIEVLKPLLRYTKVAERRDTGLQDWVPIVDKLISHFYDASQRFKSMSDESPVYEWLHICCEKAWEKLNKYYKLVDENPAYYTAMVMDPKLKFAWFEQKWADAPKCNWIPGVKSMVKSHWKQFQQQLPKPSANPPAPQQTSPQDQNTDSDEDDYKRISYAPVRNPANSFTQYAVDGAVENFKLSDWKDIEQKKPHLVQFALDHTLPISISDCERSFSSAKLTLNPLRACMKSDLFEALETLRAWYLQEQQDKEKSNLEKGRSMELEVISQVLEEAEAS